MGERMEHEVRTAYIALVLADRLGLPSADREAVYYGALLKDAGCTACAPACGTFFPDQLFPRADVAHLQHSLRLKGPRAYPCPRW